MKNVSYNDIKKAYAAKKWPWFTKAYDLNLFGIRNLNKNSNKFDDTIGVAYIDASGNERVFICPATTDPGAPYLLEPMNTTGTAILTNGYHKKMFKLGTHKGYVALAQYTPVTVVRDANRDSILDFNAPKRETGMFGINMHRAHEQSIIALVGKYSAGCQVIQVNEDLQYILSIVRLQKRYVGSDVVSYGLLMESEV